MRQIITLITFFLATLCHAENFSGKVVGITDSDTITVLDEQKTEQKVRLAGIDAPEKNQAYGQRSKQSLGALIFGKIVMVETNKRDRYGRQVGKVLLVDQDVNLEQIRRGMAWFYRKYKRELTTADQRKYDEAESEAKAGQLGLWSDLSPTPPWTFRK